MGRPTGRPARVAAEALAGDSGAYIARRHKVSPQAVSKAKQKYLPKVVPAVDFSRLIMQFAEEILNANISIAKKLQDDEYLASQSAADIAILVGVLFDKAERSLTALAITRSAAEE